MVSISNGSLSGEASIKRPLENGYVPKHKPRKVSAVRDFPPGCGPNTVPENLRPEENGFCQTETVGVVANGAGTSRLTYPMDAEMVGNSEISETAKLNGKKDSGEQNFVGSNGVKNSDIKERQPQGTEIDGVDVDGPKSLSAIVEEVLASVNVSKQLVTEIGPLRFQLPDEVGSHENPIELESDHQVLDSYVGKVTTTVTNGGGAELLPQTIPTGVEKEPETILRPKDKYRLRRVSAIRDFPPRCGLHDSLDRTEEEGQFSIPEAMPKNVFERETEKQDACLVGFQNGDDASPKTVVDDSIKDTEGPVGKEIDDCSPDINDEEGPLCDSNKEVVHGLMAAQNCPWRTSKVALKNPDGGASEQKQKQQNLSQTPKPNLSPDSNGAYDENRLAVTPISMCMDVDDNCDDDDYTGPIQNDVIVHTPGNNDETRPFTEDDDEDRDKTVLSNVDGEMNGEKKRRPIISWRKKAKARKSTPKVQSSGAPLKKKKKVAFSNDVDECIPKMQSSGEPSKKRKKKSKVHISSDVDDGANDEDEVYEGDFPMNSPINNKPRGFVVNIPPFGTSSSGPGDARMKVRETLRNFYTIYRKSLQQEEANSKPEEEGKSRQSNRIDLSTAKFLKENRKCVNTDKIIGPIPGVEVGDEFQYRVELAIVGIHFPYQSGIDSTKINNVPLCTSIVASGGYSDNLDEADVLIYSGQGGNAAGSKKSKQAEDQKLERGNLSLKNCIEAKTPVRVVRGWKESKLVDPSDVKPKLVTTYIYDGLYNVTEYWAETGPRGKQVFQFKLQRNPGQPELAWKELRKSNKSKTRLGTCLSDISEGKESLPIPAVNTVDDSKPPQFNYISKMMYPDWLSLKPPQKGCDCKGRCSDSKKCSCAERNGGEIPYNRNGALVETKTLVYECGPHCKCPPSCYNRASQRGLKYKLEIFKTEKRGWGVRPLTSIPSGSFICEYAGELLEDNVAEQRIGNDEYLFDIGHDVADSEIGGEITKEEEERGGFTIDACQYGNVGRFINHSCLPNLHAQNVVFDHVDKRMPHIMLFAMENIPPLQELTYHYNYHKGSVHDSDGNVKKKECYCGAEKCDGNLY